ncbi:hypothetical protein DFQ27_007378 [Actinomortierella ambigua]|uniref:Glucosidase II subunit alpha n=1 Tax=Actinomortierella ambigua TaxID=1343610 RepID=A0A9P6PWB0_9FUNG|nr:hypothetical protein DFQ27_007378 [Actinomortierella ambigua]
MESISSTGRQRRSRTLLRSVIALGLVLGLTHSVKREDFKTCSQSGFCTRNRAYADSAREAGGEWKSPFVLDQDSIHINPDKPGVLKATLVNTQETAKGLRGELGLEVHLLDNEAARIRITEQDPVWPRYDGVAETVLVKSYDLTSTLQTHRDTSNGVVSFQYGTKMQNTLKITAEPFRIEFLVNGTPTVLLNDQGLLRFERLRKKDEQAEQAEQAEGLTNQEAGSEEIKIEKTDLERKLEEKMWEESFKEHTDSKPRGPESIGLDISFAGMNHVYGIPEHATSMSLKATRGPGAPYSDPYRLYNLDVFEYEIDNPMALYGSIPFMLGHSKNSTAAVFWMNAAETWVDVEKPAEEPSSSGVLSWFKGKKGPGSLTSTKTHWISEAGVLDLFVFLGPTHKDIFRQYSSLVGTTALPQSFAIAYHQCRWNYNNQKDVAEVDAGFDKHDIPYDVLWLDIEHTNGKRYFTWDDNKFPNPADMQKSLAFKNRKMVTIIDPHIKMDSDYHVSKEAKELDIFIKNKDGKSDFDGWCWPGSSQWIDFYNPKARDWWASNFAYDRYVGSTKDLFTWNDMNEPSVFNGPEITIPKDVLHYGDMEHRSVHNLYGTMFHSATAEGLRSRNATHQRPFVLSRAFFAGSQRYGAIWTGDNFATWEHLGAASPMLLTIGLSGLPFSGADVGGFFGNPDPELLTRWYQAGIYYPFFRAHAHLDSKRREPWLFGEPYTSQIREAVRTRYAYLPFWYTLFYETSIDGAPIIRPMFTEFPDDEATFGMDDQYLVGSALLVKPVTQAGVTKSQVYFAGSEKWYDIKTYAAEQGPSAYKEVDSPADKIPVYQRAGTIVTKRERPRRSSKAMERDPFTLVVALDSQGHAKGRLYLDDGESYAYEQGAFILREFEVAQTTTKAAAGQRVLSSKDLTRTAPNYREQTSNQYARSLGDLRVERVVFVGLSQPISKVSVVEKAAGAAAAERVVENVQCDEVSSAAGKHFVCTIKDPRVLVREDWEILF